MDALNPVYSVMGLLLALASGHLLVRCSGAPGPAGKFATLDGLRGIVAFCVFLHHASIWFLYTHEGRWMTPPSHWYAHLGESAVTCFFMINGLLFYTKILDAPLGQVDWGGLYLSRVMRLVPLYCFAMLCLFLLVGLATGWELRDSPRWLLFSMFKWVSFTVLGAPALNGMATTHLLMAGVTWTLPYEWFFYLSLPVLALLSRGQVPVGYAIVSLLGVTSFVAWGPEPHHLLSFALGAAVAGAVRHPVLRQLVCTRIAALLALAAIALSVACFPRGNDGITPMLLYGVAFLIIAGGNDLFGFLSLPAARKLGEMSYSIYLMHGFVLYVGFKLVLGQVALNLTPVEHWLAVFGLVPLLVGLCGMTFHFIERPALRATDPLRRHLRVLRGGPIHA